MKKLLFILLAVIAVGCTKPEEKVKNYLASGKKRYEEGDLNKAKIEFKNVLQLDNKQSEAFYHLALIDERNKNWQGMFGNLTQVTRLDPKNIDAHLKLARLTLLSNMLEESLKHADAILKISPDNPDALALKGAILVKQNNPNGAMEIADKILKANPEHTDAISLKTVILLGKNEIASALALVEQALQRKPADPALLQLKLQVHGQSKNTAAVEQDYLDLISKFPNINQYSYALAKHYAENDQHDKASAILQSIVDKHPADLQPKLVLVDYLMQKNPGEAEKTINAYLGQFPNASDLHFRLAGLYIKQNKMAEAKQTLTKVIDLKKDSKESRNSMLMLAKIALLESDIETAKTYIKDILAKDKRNLDAHLLKAKLDLRDGKHDEVISDIRGVLRDFANSDEAYVLLGQAYVKKNSPQLAEENFRKAIELNPANFDALLPVVANMIKNNDATRAEELLLKALKTEPDNAGALQALAQIKMVKKDWTGAQKIADEIAMQPSGKGFGKFLSGKIAEQRGLCKEAIGLYKETLTLTPESSEALRSMAACFSSLEQEPAMLAYLSDFIAAHPDNGYAVLLKSKILTGTKKTDEAQALLESAIGKWPKATELYEAIAFMLLEKKDYPKAVDILTEGLENQADPTAMNLLLASVHEQSGDFAKALSLYEDVIAKNPENNIAVNNVVSLLLDHFNNQENNERALSLAKRFEKSEQPFFLDSYGWALVYNGRHEEALQIFKNVVSKKPEMPVFRYHLGLAYAKTGHKAEAVKELEKALELGKKSDIFADKEATEKLLSSLK